MDEPSKREASEEMQEYFKSIERELLRAYEVAGRARAKGLDPERKVDIPLARNMAERVNGIVSAAAPFLDGNALILRIKELEAQYGALDWRVALTISLEVAQEKFGKFSSKKEAMEVGIRTGFTYHTLGIVSAPLEGFTELKIKKRRDNKEYLAACFAGPIRGAGGTAAAFSLILTDYVRQKMGYLPYDPDPTEVERYIIELEDYHERVTNLQYHATPEELEFLVKNLPVEIDGEPTETLEVSKNKDLPRVETNRIRGGVALVLSMLALKAPKLWKELSKWGSEFGLDDWNFLKQFLEIQKKAKAGSSTSEKSEAKILPNYTFISDLVAGRPVLTYPMAFGGLRLRYGRSRLSGYSAAAIHPATMIVLKKYIATGTQLKLERPGKAASITPCDTIEGPIVKLENEDVIKLNSVAEANAVSGQIKEILFLGDILISYGDFLDRNHVLVPAGYTEEQYARELEKKTVGLFGTMDFKKLSELCEVSADKLQAICQNPTSQLDVISAFKLCASIQMPLHPAYTCYWKGIGPEQLKLLILAFSEAEIFEDSSSTEKNEANLKVVLKKKRGEKRALELIGLPHRTAPENIVISGAEALVLLRLFPVLEMLRAGFSQERIVEEVKREIGIASENEVLEAIRKISGIEVRDKAGTFIGARMGRPEKAKMRELTGSPHVLFPVGEEGGKMRSFQAADSAGKVTADFPLYFCEKCNSRTIYPVCENCGSETKQKFFCSECGELSTPRCKHGNARPYSTRSIDISYYLKKSQEHLQFKTIPDLIKGVRGMSSKDKIPENLAKGILRAKHKIYVNKDGTTRYDMTELPITHFRPSEIGTSIQKLRELGYTKDVYGEELTRPDQLLELKPQDIILPGGRYSMDESAAEVLLRVGNFVDELLQSFYKLPPYYNFKSREDLVGQLVIGLAPHISAGIVGRIIGFSDTQGCFAHPLMHAAHRRDCDGDENCVILLMDALLNFSRQYLPDKRGSRTMDSPLVLTSKLVPAEVDDMVQKLDVCWNYPLEFYEACSNFQPPGGVKMDILGSRIGTELQYEGMGFTHDVRDMNEGVNCSAYKTIISMEDKLKGQMELAELIRAVDEADVARLVIEKHFIKDIKGNLRKFSIQQFRCVDCNEKYRRVPLAGKCTRCGGKLIFTVSKGFVLKYLEPSISIAEKYKVPQYLKHSLELVKRRVEGVFGKDREKQEGLGRWFS
ncbi:MAG: DNA polymerase II large subunit [Candidatus Woesearchaeota archaeon]